MKQYCVIIIILVNFFFNSVLTQEEYCYSNDNDKKQTKHFGTKTPYEVARGSEKRYFNVPKCEAVKFWLISRHGTRNPSEKGIERMKKLLDVRDVILENFKRFDRDRHLNQLCSEDLEILKNWRLDRNLSASYANYLTVQGWNDLKYMGIDFQRTFQNVIETRYSKEKFRFGYTDTQRTEASYKAFVEGLFGPNADAIINVSPEGNNSILLRPYEACPQWLKEEEMVKDKNSEFSKFQESEVFKKMLEEVSVRLGYKYTLNAKQVDDMWDMCRYDQAWYLQEPSPWCAAFTREHVDVLEYLEDLKYYSKGGYANQLNSKVMCAAVKDMLKTLETEHLPKTVAYFTHASAIQLFLTALNYAKDNDALRADNYNQMKNRQFRSSVLSPFASNVAVVKYDCPEERNRYKVQFFLNERPMDFEWCNVGLCDLREVLFRYREFLEADCKNMYCGGNNANLKILSVPIIVFVTIIKFIF